jgi:methyl-accepting chemotaxis protein
MVHALNEMKAISLDVHDGAEDMNSANRQLKDELKILNESALAIHRIVAGVKQSVIGIGSSSENVSQAAEKSRTSINRLENLIGRFVI